MKIWHKVILIISAIVLSIGLLIGGGYLYMKHQYQQEQEYMKKVVYSDEAQEAFKKCLKNIDPKAFTKEGIIHSYTIDKSNIEHNPMGGINVGLIVNNNKKLYVEGILDKRQNKLKIGIYSYSPELDQLTKEDR